MSDYKVNPIKKVLSVRTSLPKKLDFLGGSQLKKTINNNDLDCQRAEMGIEFRYYLTKFKVHTAGSNKEQDHQRWGYSTVTHMEKPVYMAIWKDLKNERKKNTAKRLNHRNGKDG